MSYLFDGNSFITKPKKHTAQIICLFFQVSLLVKILLQIFLKRSYQITRKYEKFPFHRKILEDPIKQINQ